MHILYVWDWKSTILKDLNVFHSPEETIPRFAFPNKHWPSVQINETVLPVLGVNWSFIQQIEAITEWDFWEETSWSARQLAAAIFRAILQSNTLQEPGVSILRYFRRKLLIWADFIENAASFIENSILTIFTGPKAKRSEMFQTTKYKVGGFQCIYFKLLYKIIHIC